MDLVRSENPNVVNILLVNDRVDFVICDKTSLNMLCGIQLHDPAMERIKTVFDQVDIPLIELKVGATYSNAELKEILSGVLPESSPGRSCARCHKPMAIKMARSGSKSGQYFWVCKTCKLTSAVR